MTDTPPSADGNRVVMLGVAALALVGIGGLTVWGLSGQPDEITSVSAPEPSPATTTTIASVVSRPAAETQRKAAATTTTTSTSTSTTSTSTTTTTEPVPTTSLVTSSPAAPAVPVWDPFEPLPGLDGIAALTGLAADDEVTARPILAAKVDNYPSARPQWNLDLADVIFEENVEGVTRFVALFHTNVPDSVGPIRSARTGDLDILASMNRPILAWSGGNPGVTAWVESAASSGVLVDFSAQKNACYSRSSSRRIPHNLLLDPSCALGRASTAGPARPLWDIDEAWVDPGGIGAVAQGSFNVSMDGVSVDWAWNADEQRFMRSQNGNRHTVVSGSQIGADNVIELFVEHPPSPVDARSPNPVTVGTGAAVIHRDGLAIPATWTRVAAIQPFEFVDSDGVPIQLDTGTTFVELVRLESR